MRTFRPWSPIWWWDIVGYDVKSLVVFWAFLSSLGSVAVIAAFPLRNAFDWLVVAVGIGFVLLLALVPTLGLILPASLYDYFFSLPGKPSDGVRGEPIFEVDAMSGHFSHGLLIVTTEVVAFVPGAYRSTGKAGKWESEIIIPFCEIASMHPYRVWIFLPIGLRFTRTSGDLEYFTVSRPRHVIREIDKARYAWRVAAAAQPRVCSE